MKNVKVKICGFTRVEDVLAAIDLGVDYLGFNFFAGSPRFLAEEKAREIFAEIPPTIPKVGVFVNEDLQRVLDLAIDLPLDFLQFHGDEAAEELNTLARPWFKALRIQGKSDLEKIPLYHSECVLLDAYDPQSYGGTGQRLDWELVKEAKSYNKKIILAGGLNPSNIAAAIEAVEPFAVDVASGVESEPGIKDVTLMERFIRNAKSHLHVV